MNLALQRTALLVRRTPHINNYYHFCFQLLLKRQDIEELSHHNAKIADIVALEIGSVGENIAVRRAASLRADDDGHVGYYVHSSCVYSNGNSCHIVLMRKLHNYDEFVWMNKDDKTEISFVGNILCLNFFPDMILRQCVQKG